MKLTSQILSLTCLTPTFWPAKTVLKLICWDLRRGHGAEPEVRYWARFDAKDLEALRPGPAVQGLGDFDQAVVVIVGAEAAASKAGPSARGPVAAGARPDGEGQGDGRESPAGAASRRPR